MGRQNFRPALKWMIGLLFLAAILAYVAFSLREPMPFFTTPPNCSNNSLSCYCRQEHGRWIGAEANGDGSLVEARI